jgi:rhamnulose-1-phosphate aldolase
MTKQTLDEILTSMGRAGRRLNEIDACEAGAGNISACVSWDLDLESRFPQSEELDLPWTVPGLAGRTVLVTGNGCRLRDILDYPEATVSAVRVHEGGVSGTWFTSPRKEFVRPTSEFNSHLAVHEDQVTQRGVDFQALIHAQPPYLVVLSSIPSLRTDREMNRRILRWEPETIVQIPQGVKVLDFMLPGSQELMENNIKGLRDHQIVVWSKHGVMARSDVSALSAVDKVEYAETGAMYEYRDMAGSGLGEGLSDDEMKAVIDAFHVQTDLY